MKRVQKKKIKDILLGNLSLGYKFQMSDYATSIEDEIRYEKEGMQQVDDAVDQITKYIRTLAGDK